MKTYYILRTFKGEKTWQPFDTRELRDGVFNRLKGQYSWPGNGVLNESFKDLGESFEWSG